MERKDWPEEHIKGFGWPEEGSRDLGSVEELYQAFKERLIEELRISGGACEGVVYGRLENRGRAS